MNKFVQTALACSGLLLGGCATVVDAQSPERAPEASEFHIRPVLQPSPRAELMYQVLAAELAGKRDQLPVALEHYRQLATANDTQLVERATMLALLMKDASALELARRWYALAPAKESARQALTLALLRNGQVDEAAQYLEAVRKAASRKDQQQGFATVASLLSQTEDKAAALRVMQQFSQRHPRSAFAQHYLAMLASAANDRALALASLDRALALNPKFAPAHLLRARLFMEQGDQKAVLASMAKAVAALPRDRNLRMNYARLLVDAGQLPNARRQFAILLNQNPQDADSIYALGVLAAETHQYDLAESYFQKLIKRNARLPEVFFELGQLQEKRGDYAKANDWYGRVSGDRYLIAQLRKGVMLAKGGENSALGQHFESLRRAQPQDSITLYLAEAEAWGEAGRYQEAVDVLGRGLALHANNKDLLYARALAAEKLDRLDLLEQDLRAILAVDPKNGQALNALGYTLADRTDRLAEALGYIEQALAVLPDDAAVLDSMGWVHYRLGDPAKALSYLRRAYQANPDAEIAAHLVEVLWESGQRDEAKRIWHQALKKTPESEFLRKLKGKLGE